MKKQFVSMSVVGLLTALVGCGSGEYEKRLEANVGQVKKGSSFRGMQPATSLPGVPVSVRLPEQLDGPPLVEGSGVEDRRRLVPNAKLPGLCMTVEGFVTDSEGGKIAYYGYFGAADLSGPIARDYDRLIRAVILAVCPDATPSWSPVEGQTPAGAAVEWQRAEATSQQEFYYVDSSGNADYRTTNGRFEVWTRREGGYLLIMAWRVPTDFLPSTGLDQWLPRVAGTMTVAAANEGG
jgi:hypothetical protein